MEALQQQTISDQIMKTCFVLTIVLVMYTNACCKQTEDEGYKPEDSSNLTKDEFINNFMKPQVFTAGTLLGLLVASMVVVIGSFLVLWRLCCEVEMVVTREVMEPLKSISKTVGDKSPRLESRSVSGQLLLNQSCASSVVEIA